MLRIAGRPFGLLCASLGLIALTSLVPQRARASDDVQLCDNSTNDPDEGIPACTRIINGAQVSKPEIRLQQSRQCLVSQGRLSERDR